MTSTEAGQPRSDATGMTVIRGGSTPYAITPRAPRPNAHVDAAKDRHPTALGRQLDSYLGAVADELQARGVVTCSPQRSDPAQRLIGSIVLDCTALRLSAGKPDHRTTAATSLGRAIRPEHPAPVVASWDESTGWCVGMHHDASHASSRYLHPDLLPVPHRVADFVVGLALGQDLGAAEPIGTRAVSGRPRLHLMPRPEGHR